MKFTLKNLALVTAVSMGLAACSEESAETVTVDDGAPTLVLGATSASIDEGSAISIAYNADDDISLSSVAIVADDILGNVVIGESEIRYTAPWLSADQAISETFSVLAMDGAGQSTTVDVTITVNDLNSPVSVVMSPPSQASGFSDTRTDTSLDFWIDEGQERVTLSYALTEEDADQLVLGFSLGNEDFIYENNIEATQTTSGNVTTVELSFLLPEIKDTANTVSTTSEDIELTLTVSDGDDTVAAVANMTVVNVVSLNWAAGNPSTISELEGGVLTFTSSESTSYPGEYNVEFTDVEGEPLDFEIPYVLDEDARTITIGQSEDFFGDKTVLVNLTLTNTINNSAGQSKDVIYDASREVTFIDDNDQGFLASEADYENNVSLYGDVIISRYEDRVASAVSTYLFLNWWIDADEAEEFKDSVSNALNAEVEVLTALLESIEEDLGNGSQGDAVIEKMDKFESLTYGFGYSARDFITTKLEEYDLADDSRSLVLGSLSVAKKAQLYIGGDEKTVDEFEDGAVLTHYVGNAYYGSFQDGDWIFNARHRYLGAVGEDYLTPGICF